jgi:acyl-CoA thioesterase I
MYYRFILLIILLSFFSVSVQAKTKTLLILGDSISAAYGIPVERGWVSLLEQRLFEQGYAYKVVNASISGETTLGAKMRLNTLLEKHQPELVVIELGGNDGLRGFTLKEIENNFIEMISMIKQAGCAALIIPMQLPPNYGAIYNQRFASVYERVSETMAVAKSKFILQNIAEHSELMQADGIHPVQIAQSMMLDNIWQDLQNLLVKEPLNKSGRVSLREK